MVVLLACIALLQSSIDTSVLVPDTKSEESDYYNFLRCGMPPPSSFAKVWPAFQYPSLGNEAFFKPLLNIHRPHTAQVG